MKKPHSENIWVSVFLRPTINLPNNKVIKSRNYYRVTNNRNSPSNPPL